jgi:peptidoglycan hydrolase-like protein with peptidoglycan-binding domain
MVVDYKILEKKIRKIIIESKGLFSEDYPKPTSEPDLSDGGGTNSTEPDLSDDKTNNNTTNNEPDLGGGGTNNTNNNTNNQTNNQTNRPDCTTDITANDILNNGMPVKKGMCGEIVFQIQTNLWKHGYGEVVIDGEVKEVGRDGNFGPTTEAAVKKFQTDKKTTAQDGIVDDVTWAELIRAKRVPPKPLPTPTPTTWYDPRNQNPQYGNWDTGI